MALGRARSRFYLVNINLIPHLLSCLQPRPGAYGFAIMVMNGILISVPKGNYYIIYQACRDPCQQLENTHQLACMSYSVYPHERNMRSCMHIRAAWPRSKPPIWRSIGAHTLAYI